MQMGKSEEGISVVIPTLNCVTHLAELLKSIPTTQEVFGVEVLVVDSNSEDGTDSLAESLGARILSAPRSRSVARNVGAQHATFDRLAFFDCDMLLSPLLLPYCFAGLTEFDALCIREVTLGGNYWSRARSLERDACFGTTIFESARCFRRDVFHQLGGYDPDIDGLEDPDLQARLVRRGFTVGWVEQPVFHDEKGVGLAEYLGKRRVYSYSDRLFRKRHAALADKLSSPSARFRLVLKTMKASGLRNTVHLIPGWAFIRASEFLVRRVTGYGIP